MHHKKRPLKHQRSFMISAGDRNRTGTGGKSRRILSPVRLPVPPCRHTLLVIERRVLPASGWRWIRTTESIANRFTVCPLWPLGNPSISLSQANFSLSQHQQKIKSFFIIFPVFQPGTERENALPGHFPILRLLHLTHTSRRPPGSPAGSRWFPPSPGPRCRSC